MATISFVQTDGVIRRISARGGTLMEAAVSYGIDGIDALCGGACACATCHVYVDDAWISIAGPPHDNERDLLAGTDFPKPNSRLSCQIELTEALDGMTVEVAPRNS